jgi:hypothetical protein
LISTNPNLKIDNLKKYLMKIVYGIDNFDISSKTQKQNKITNKATKRKQKYNIVKSEEKTISLTEWEDDEPFEAAIQEIINTDIIVKDKFGREGNIVLTGEYLRFIPLNSTSPNIAMQKQYVKTPITRKEIDLRGYLTRINEEHKKLLSSEELNYDDILKNVINKIEHLYYGVNEKFNSKITIDEATEIVFTGRISHVWKNIILQGLIAKHINNIKMSEYELKLSNIIKHHLIYMKDIYPDYKEDINNENKNIYGFIIAVNDKLELYVATENNNKNNNNDKLQQIHNITFEKNLGNIKKVIEFKKSLLKIRPNGKIYAYLKYEKDKELPVFKIIDTHSKGEKKSVTGITCITDNTNGIEKNINALDDKLLKGRNINYNKTTLCNDLELLLRRNDNKHKDKLKWFYNPEDYIINF